MTITQLKNKTLVKRTAIIAICGSAMLIPAVAALAWSTSQSAGADCTQSGSEIHVSFTNTETNPAHTMHVVAKDTQSGQSSDLGSVAPQQTQSGDIATGKTSVSNGTVTFSLTWANGTTGSDTRTADYTAITCTAPTITPTQTLSITPTGGTPSISETPTPSCSPTPTPSETPSITPTVTPTETLTSTPTPTPNTPTINVVVQSSEATNTPSAPQVQSAPKTQELPKTGSETNILFGLLSLIPAGIKLRRISK